VGGLPLLGGIEMNSSDMDIVKILQRDYQKFPLNQTYSIYEQNVYFKDPLNEFSGLTRYQKMIAFMQTWFKDIKMDLHSISSCDDRIDTEWTLSWISPLPWKPPISIKGRSELKLNQDDKIISHIDYWYCSRWDVLRQHLKLL
jgi:hypothetical protein